jgi:outer membrane immunogenic protein
MKRILFSFVLLIFFFSSMTAFAAGPAYNWTGFYAGLQGTYAYGNTNWEYADNLAHADHTINGWMGGLLLGYNYQFPVNVVVGVETEVSTGKIYGSTSCPNPSFLANSNVSWAGSTRARVGYAIYRFLPYIGIGVAYGRAEIYTTDLSTGIDYSEKNTYVGWTPNIGLEFAITQNLIARAEYAYYDLGTKQSTVDFGLPVNSRITFQAFKFGLSWKF